MPIGGYSNISYFNSRVNIRFKNQDSIPHYRTINERMQLTFKPREISSCNSSCNHICAR